MARTNGRCSDPAVAVRGSSTPLGDVVIVASARGLRSVAFGAARVSRVDGVDDAARRVAEAAVRQLDAYFAGEQRVFDVPIDPMGTPFDLAVRDVLRSVPYGKTVTYSEVARRMGRPSAVRAVGAANGRNPVAIVVPCHRVVGADGRLVGYAAGLARKRALLELEGVRVAGDRITRQRAFEP